LESKNYKGTIYSYFISKVYSLKKLDVISYDPNLIDFTLELTKTFFSFE